MILTKQIYNNIKIHAQQSYPEECCGLIYSNEGNTYSEACRNIADNKIHSFTIHPNDYLSISKRGNIVGIYHSHAHDESLDSDFSFLDKRTSNFLKLFNVLFLLKQNRFLVYNDKKINNRYIGIPFEYNKNDCFSLAVDFYRQEFNISIPNYSRSSQLIKDNPNIIIDNILTYDFAPVVDKENLQKGDIIISNSLYGPTHIMIFIGNNQILHHRFNNYSNIELYSNIYKQHTHNIYRHKSLWN